MKWANTPFASTCVTAVNAAATRNDGRIVGDIDRGMGRKEVLPARGLSCSFGMISYILRSSTRHGGLDMICLHAATPRTHYSPQTILSIGIKCETTSTFAIAWTR